MHHLAKLIRNPLLVIGAAGNVAELNEAARDLCGDVTHGSHVFVNMHDAKALLAHAAGRSEPVPGTLDVRTRQGAVHRLDVNALALGDTDPAEFVLEIRDDTAATPAGPAARERAEREQILLEREMARSQLLYTELQHRVKNNLQMIISLIAIAEREDRSLAGLAFLQGLKSKLAALMYAQQIMYDEAAGEGVRSDKMIAAVAASAQALGLPGTRMMLDLESAALPNDIAFSLALIANELLTNAAKYGCREANGAIDVALRRLSNEVVLTVRDHGPGFTVPATGRASSGLGLVRGLCRQIGGRFDIQSTTAGTIAHVYFPLREAANYAG